jgi:hypothetical protein
MDEEQHLDGFHMDNDFEGLVEVGGEFMYRSVSRVAADKRQRILPRADEQPLEQCNSSSGPCQSQHHAVMLLP